MGGTCAAKLCKNKSYNCKKSFFRFPRDISRSRTWVISCGREDLLEKLEILHDGYVLCQDHFESKLFKNEHCDRLKTDVVPTLFPALEGYSRGPSALDHTYTPRYDFGEQGVPKINVLQNIIIYSGATYNTELYDMYPEYTWSIKRNDNEFFAYNIGKDATKICFELRNKKDPKKHCVDMPSGEMRTIKFPEKMKNFSVSLINEKETKGFMYIYGTHLGFDEFGFVTKYFFNIDTKQLGETLIKYGAGNLPDVTGDLSKIIDFFWPKDQEEGIFREVSSKFIRRLNITAREQISKLISEDLVPWKFKLKACDNAIKSNNKNNTGRNAYMNVAQDLIGFEKKVNLHIILDTTEDSEDRSYMSIRDNIETNFYLLPLYSSLVNIKILFYQYGILQGDTFGLDKKDIKRVINYLKKLKDADKRFKRICTDMIEVIYGDEGFPDSLYDEMASTRFYCAVGAYEHSNNWKRIIADPKSTKKTFDPISVYSNAFGRSTAPLIRQMIVDEPSPPLRPKEIDGKANVINEVEIYTLSEQSPVIGLLKVNYANGDTAQTGLKNNKPTGPTVKVDFKNKMLIKLVAHGTGQIDALEFHFSDGSSKTVGTVGGDSRAFQLDKHYIVGFYTTVSPKIKELQSANIAVNYQPISDK